jgi:hypothetical protein
MGFCGRDSKKSQHCSVDNYPSGERKCELENSYAGIEKTNARVDV